MNLFQNDLLLFLPEIYFIISIIYLLIFGVFYTNKKTKFGFFSVQKTFLSISSFLLINYVLLLLNNPKTTFTLFNSYLISDISIVNFKILIVFFALLFIPIFQTYIANLKNFDFEFLAIFLFILYSMLLLINSNDLISFYVAIELQSLCFYILTASKQTSSFSSESGLKYFIIGSFSSGILLFGLIMIYGFSGLFNFNELSLFCQFLTKDQFVFNGFLLGLFFLTFALLFKIGLAPFHMWIPDVYEGAPTAVTALMSVLPKLALFFIFVKIYYLTFFSLFYVFSNFLLFCAIISIAIGSVAALYQVKIKRMLTYSLIANNGFLILVFSLGGIEGISIGFFYLYVYSFITLGLFACLISLYDIENNFVLKRINMFSNLFEINLALAFSFFIFLFSIAGIPPLIGFYSKFFIFSLCLKNKLFVVSLIFVIFSIVSIFYYLRLTKLIFFNRSKN